MIARRPRPVQAHAAISPGHTSRCRIFTGSETSRVLHDPTEISELLKDEANFVWFDLAEPTAEDLALLQEEFALHPTAVEDAALVHERPKIEGYDGYALVVLHAATLDHAGDVLLHELAVFVGRHFVVTIRAHPPFPIAEIERRRAAHPDRQPEALNLLYLILDVVVDAYGPVALAYEERLLALENAVLAREQARRENVLRDVLRLKRELVELRRAAGPLRDILGTLLRGDIVPLDRSMQAYFRDVHDHALRLTDQIDSMRELLNSTLDIHLSSEAHRQGEVAKQLTVIATIFLPLTYITGFFGQNFGWMVNRIEGAPQFWLIGVGSQIAALALLYAYFAHKRWV